MSGAVKDMALVPVEEQKPEQAVSLFERLARDQSMDVDKLERLMQMHERVSARVAEEAFNSAMSQAQTKMRPIAADANNPQTKSKYATYGKLDGVLRPIYTEHGFGLSFDTGDGAPVGWVRVLCYVTHSGGHARTYHADMPADGKGAKGGDVMTVTHAVGAAMSYGMRYLLKMIFNVAVGEDDQDGNGPIQRQQPKAPAGFENWLIDLQATADNGLPALSAAWKGSKPEFRDHLKAIDPAEIDRLKAKANQVTK